MFKFSEIYKDKVVFIKTNVLTNNSPITFTGVKIIDEDEYFLKIETGTTESYLNKSNILHITEMQSFL